MAGASSARRPRLVHGHRDRPCACSSRCSRCRRPAWWGRWGRWDRWVRWDRWDRRDRWDKFGIHPTSRTTWWGRRDKFGIHPTWRDRESFNPPQKKSLKRPPRLEPSLGNAPVSSSGRRLTGSGAKLHPSSSGERVEPKDTRQLFESQAASTHPSRCIWKGGTPLFAAPGTQRKARIVALPR